MTYLAAQLESAITNSLKSRVSDREDFWLLALFKFGLPQVAATLASLYGGRTSIGAVWCHSTPKVEFLKNGSPLTPTTATGPSCELGDLLLVTSKLLDNGVQVNRSLLLQLKRYSMPGSSSADQDFLYEHWPQFRYKAAPTELRHVRAGTAGQRHFGAQYGVLFRQGEAAGLPAPTVAVAESNNFSYLKSLSGSSLNHKLSLQIVQMLADLPVAGRSFLSEADQRRDRSEWSKVVWDLLTLAFVKANQFRSNKRPQGSRTWNIACFTQGRLPPEALTEAGSIPDLDSSFWSADGSLSEFDDLEVEPGNNDLDGPISTIFVQLDARTPGIDLD